MITPEQRAELLKTAEAAEGDRVYLLLACRRAVPQLIEALGEVEAKLRDVEQANRMADDLNAQMEARAINAEQKAEYWQRAFGRLVAAHQRELQAVLQERPSRELPDALTSEDFEPDMPVCTEVE